MNSIKGLIRFCLNRVFKLITTIGNLTLIIKLFSLSYRHIQQRKILIGSIRNFNDGRYGFQLLNYFSKAGYHIIFFKSNKFLMLLYGYDRLIFKLQTISLWRNFKRLTGKYITWLYLNIEEKNARRL